MTNDTSGPASTPTEAQVLALAEAMGQLLDDMGDTSQSVCLYAKAKARIAYEPFMALMEDDPEFYLPLAEAQRIVEDTDNGR
jgi:hypothetical protein